MPSEGQIRAAAESDAKFDGNSLAAMSRLARERYLERAKQALKAAERVARRELYENSDEI